jgi:Beta-galactosidase
LSAFVCRPFIFALAKLGQACLLPLRLGALMALSCAVLLGVSQAHAAEWPYGVFSLTPPNKPVNAEILTNPSVAGVTIRGNWQNIETSEGVYNWSYFDTQIARVASAGKVILLRIISGGLNTPQWVFDAGVQTFSFVDPKSMQTVTIPVFWDPIFLAKKKNFIAAMGRHFAAKPNIVLVSTSCANATTDDWFVPHSNTDVQNWLALGYTSQKLINACNGIVDTAMKAFPNQFALMAVAQNSTKLDPTKDYVARQVVNSALTSYPRRFIAQKNSLSADAPDPSLLPVLGAWQIIYDNQPNVAGQMLWFVTNDSTCRMDGGVKPCSPVAVLQEAVTIGAQYGMRYQEIYQVDILNPELAGVISYAAGLLRP